ncbi:unnamed protein product [Diatraea saccharalis]|uniref:Peptidase S1 domain-containing protein n=1 Tax=Diatraea saccharalis TaxID=40085 RepID=A0A9N9WLJ1_9NEOP|nr:unnamed protein product [Diatraea saccharalis]
MMSVLVALLVVLALVAAAPKNPQRIVGGSLTTIDQHPDMVSLLWSPFGFRHSQNCGGSILTNRAVLTAAHCTFGHHAFMWQSRVGSTFANSGGAVHTTSRIINHPQYISATLDNDIAIIHTTTVFVSSNVVQQASIAGSGYNLGDNQEVWAAGWGRLYYAGPSSEQLRHVQVWTINQAVCRARYAERQITITDNMLCSGWLEVGGRDQCNGDSGGPLYHNRVVVGVSSFGYGCAQARWPGVNARVSRYTQWILANSQ